MVRARSMLGAAIAIGAAWAAVTGCAQLLGSEDYEFFGTDGAVPMPGPVEEGDAGDGAAPSCVDPDGFGPGLACWSCPPASSDELLSACTSARCEPFDRARVPDGGVTIDPDAGSDPPPAAETPVGTPCEGLPNVVYGVGGTDALDVLGVVARSLAAEATPITIVYDTSGASCASIDALVDKTPIQGTAVYWDPSVTDVAAAQRACDLPAGGVVPDFARADVFASSCRAEALPVSVRDVLGPVQTLVFAVPLGSTQRTIDREAARRIWGLGAASGVSPWTDEAFIVRPPETAGARRMASTLLDLPVAGWKGVLAEDGAAAADRLAALTAPAEQDKAIALVFQDALEANRTALRALAYQDPLQGCAMWPDASETARDKRNVRDGHYPLWGPSHLFFDGALGGVKKTAVDRLAGVLDGTVAWPGGGGLAQLVQLHVAAGRVPECAMRVKRASDGGPIEPFRPAAPCGCYFDFAATGASSCKACTAPQDCTTGACTLGFCEE